MTDLSFILPTINEAGNVGALIRALRETFPGAAFIVIDGDSSDATRQEAQAEGARVLVNVDGYAASLLQGLREAASEWALVMDADGSHTAQDALKLWQARESADLVVGSRFAAGGGSDGSALRRSLTRVLASLFAVLARLPARDVSSGFRLYRRAMFAGAKINARFFEVQPALLAWAKAQNARVKEVGIHYHQRGKGRSKNRVLRYGFAFLRQLWRVRRVS